MRIRRKIIEGEQIQEQHSQSSNISRNHKHKKETAQKAHNTLRKIAKKKERMKEKSKAKASGTYRCESERLLRQG
jgi:hypothetical protein